MKVLLAGSIALFILSTCSAGYLYVTMPQSCVSPQKICDYPITSADLLYCGNMLVLAYWSPSISVLVSEDGKTWSTIESAPAEVYDEPFSRDITLIKDGETLGVVWADSVGESRISTFFMSMYNGKTWSEPCLLFQRENFLHFKNALLLENGLLLLMWEEPALKYSQGTTSDWDHSTVYRAAVYGYDVHIEPVMQSDSPSCCVSRPSFIENNIICVFHYSNGEKNFFKTESTDGITWSLPEPFNLSEDYVREFINLGGEIAAVKVQPDKILLNRSTDWKEWESEVLVTGDGYIEHVSLAQDSTGVLWVAYQEGATSFISHRSEDLLEEQQKTRKYVIALLVTACCASFAIPGLLFFSMWKSTAV